MLTFYIGILLSLFHKERDSFISLIEQSDFNIFFIIYLQYIEHYNLVLLGVVKLTSLFVDDSCVYTIYLLFF